MVHRVLVILLLFGVDIPSCLLHEYHSVNLKMNWIDAQHYCRMKYTDLATIGNMDDISRLNRSEFGDASQAWIGLADDPKSWQNTMGKRRNSWKWSATGKTRRTTYHNWGPSQPDNLVGNQSCVTMNTYGTWNDAVCQYRRHFVCYNDTTSGMKNYTFIQNKLPWKDAQAYCRTHHTDLAVIENAQENNKVFSIKKSNFKWIGLHRVPWMWSDKSSSSFRRWDTGRPNNYNQHHFCVAEILQSRRWGDFHCQAKLPFFCHGAPKVKVTVVRMKIQTDADMTDPATKAQILRQLHALLTNQGVTDVRLYWKTQPGKQEE